MPLPHNLWYQVKLFAQHASGLSMDGLHVIAGVVLQLAFARLLRSSVARAAPLLAVLLLEIVNEIYDFTVELWPSLAMQLGEGAKDILLTMLLPSLLYVVARARPALFACDGGENAISAEAVEGDSSVIASVTE